MCSTVFLRLDFTAVRKSNGTARLGKYLLFLVYRTSRSSQYIPNAMVKTLNILTTVIQILWTLIQHLNLSCCRNQERACEFTAWFDYITNVLVEFSNAEECASREADTVKDFMKTKDTLLVQVSGGWQRVWFNRGRSH